MIPVPPGPGDIRPTPEGFHPAVRGGESTPLLMQTMEEIDALRRAVRELGKRLETLENRVAALEAPAKA